MNNRVSDLSFSVFDGLNKIQNDIKYLIDIGELKDIRNCRDKMNSYENTIKFLDALQATSPLKHRKITLEEQISKLNTLLKSLCTSEWNGFDEYDRIRDNPRQCCEYIVRRAKYGDVCLSFLVNKYENIMETTLADHDIDKNVLFPN